MATKSKAAHKKKPSARVGKINKSHKQKRTNKRIHNKQRRAFSLFLATIFLIVTLTFFICTEV